MRWVPELGSRTQPRWSQESAVRFQARDSARRAFGGIEGQQQQQQQADSNICVTAYNRTATSTSSPASAFLLAKSRENCCSTPTRCGSSSTLSSNRSQSSTSLAGALISSPACFSLMLLLCICRYATHPALNSWTPLIHDEYASLVSSSAQHAASSTVTVPSMVTSMAAPVHLTLDVESLQIKAYASARLGLAMDTGSNRTFLPLKTEMKADRSEHGGRASLPLLPCTHFLLLTACLASSDSRDPDKALSTSSTIGFGPGTSFDLAARCSPRLAARHAYRCLEHA